MMDSLEVLKAIAQQVRNATEIGENTAERIGRFLVGIIEWIKTENFDEKYLRKDVEDWAQQLIHFMNGIDVKNHAVFNDTLSSEDFLSGFTSGKGWAIWLKNFINAAGKDEKLACMELDELTIRKTLKVFEFIISQMRGENDNVTFSGFMKVDHFDEETGRIYLKTDDGQLYNPFRIDDYLYCQQFNGMPSEENDYTVLKNYEFIVTDAQVGSLEDKDKRLDWITLKNFVGDLSLIQENDVLVRLDNLSNPDRKGIIQMMTVGNATPYMDILYGTKTDPDNALKSRFGNLQGIYHHLFGWLQAFGAYIINLYAVGDFRIRQTGEDMDSKVEMLKGMFQTHYQKLTYDLTEDDNYLKNAAFTENLEGWIAENDVKFITLNDDTLVLNRSTVVSKDKVASIEEYDGKNILHLSNSYVRQSNTDVRKPGTHKEYSTISAGEISEAYTEVKDTLYLSLKFFCKRSGTLTIGFEGSTITEKSLPYTVMQVASSSDWLIYKWSGDWDGKGDFVLKFTGDMYVSLLAVTDSPLNDYKKEVSTSIQQTATNIRLLGTNINNLKGTVTDLGIDLDAANERISIYANKVNGLEGTVTNLGINLDAAKEQISLYANKVNNLESTVTSLGVRLNAAESNITLYATKVGNNEAAISALQIRADSISSAVTSVQGDLNTVKARIESVKAIAEAAGDAETYNQSNNPWNSWSGGTEYKHVNATWHNTSDGHTYRYIGYDNTNSWEDVTNIQSSASYVLQNKDKISTVVSSFDSSGKLTNTSGLVTTSYASSIYATKTNVDSLSGRVSTAESRIDVHSTQITMRVEKDGIISAINQSAEKIKIKASQIELEGTVTANDNVMITTDGRIIGKGAQFENVIMQSKTVSIGGSVYTSVPVSPKIGDVYSVNANSLKLKGDSSFANLPKTNLSVGDCYRIIGKFTLGFIDYPAYTYLMWTSLGWNIRYGLWTYQSDGWEILHGAVWRSDMEGKWTVHINPQYCTSYFATGGSISHPVDIFPPSVDTTNYGTILRLYSPSDIMSGDEWHCVNLCFADTTIRDERTVYLKEGGHGGYAELTSTPKGWNVKGTHMGCNEQLCIRALIVGNSYRYYESVDRGVGGSSFINYQMTVERKEKGVANIKLTSYHSYFFKDAIFRVYGYGGVDDNLNAPIKATLFSVTELSAYSVMLQVRLSDDASVNDPYMDITGFMLDVYLGNSLYL